MKLTRHTDYAMRLLMYLGQHPDRLCTIAEIAGVYGISVPHLMKITHNLAQCGWIETVRGKNGGMRLAHPPENIRLGDVVRDTENDLDLVECFTPEKSGCTLQGNCALSGIIHGALEQFLSWMNNYTLADIIPAKPLASLGAIPIRRIKPQAVSR